MEQILLLSLFSLLWTVLFLVIRSGLVRTKSFDFCNRVVSVVHVFVAIFLCVRSLEDWHQPLANVGGENTQFQNEAIVVSLAYFIYDLFCCLFDPNGDPVNSIHHLLTILGLGYGLVGGKSGTELLACLWLMELSNPFMHARELFKELGIKDSPLALINDVTFAVVFTIARMIIGPWIVWTTLQSDKSHVTVKIGALGIQVVSVFWWYKIARVVSYKLSGKKRAATANKQKRK